MYDDTDFDRAFVRARVAEFRGQVDRRIEGALTEDEFLPPGCATASTCSSTPTCCGSLSPTAR